MSLIFSIIGNNICYGSSNTSNIKETGTGQVVTAPNSDSQDVTFINKGVEAPYTGYLFTSAKAALIKKELMELDEFRALADSYQKSIDDYKKNEDLYNFKVNTLLDQNDKLSNALYKKEDRDAFENKFYFVLGIFLTGASVYLATKLQK